VKFELLYSGNYRNSPLNAAVKTKCWIFVYSCQSYYKKWRLSWPTVYMSELKMSDRQISIAVNLKSLHIDDVRYASHTHGQ